jgi:hypothetical protein
LLIALTASPALAASRPRLPPSFQRADLVPSELINGAIGDPFGTAIFISAHAPTNLLAAVVVRDLVELDTDLSVYLFVDTFLHSQATLLGTLQVNTQGQGSFIARAALPTGTHTLILSLEMPGCDGDSSCTVLITPGHFGFELSMTFP